MIWALIKVLGVVGLLVLIASFFHSLLFPEKPPKKPQPRPLTYEAGRVYWAFVTLARYLQGRETANVALVAKGILASDYREGTLDEFDRILLELYLENPTSSNKKFIAIAMMYRELKESQ